MRNVSKLLGLALVAGSLASASVAHAATPSYVSRGSVVGTATTSAFFGYSVAIDGDTAVVGSIADNANKGAAYVFVRGAQGWTRQQELTPSDGGTSGAQFGYSVAIAGTTIMVGAPGLNTQPGSVYVYARGGTVWSPVLPVLNAGSGAQAGDCFGCAIALRAGSALIGAPNAFGTQGEAYAFSGGVGGWTQSQAFLGAVTAGYFGYSVSLSSDASTAIIGAFGDPSPATNAAEVGQAFLYNQSVNGWLSGPVLRAADGQAHDRFGYAVAVDGDMAIVGAYGRAGNTGGLYVYNRTAGAWAQSGPPLLALDAAANDYFGYSVALSGQTAIVGAYEKTGPMGPGAVYALSQSGGLWAQQKLLAPTFNQYFGYSVGASNTSIIVGAFGANNDVGTAYLFDNTTPAPALGHPLALVGLTVLLIGIGLVSSRSRLGGHAS